MKYYSIPSDFKKETIDELVKLNNKYSDSCIFETYGNVTIDNSFGCGRSISELPEISLEQLKDYVSYSKLNGIEFNYTLNTSHMQNEEFTSEGILKLKNLLENLHHAGCRNLTITLPSLIEIVNSMDYEFNIKASAICSIDNPNIALAFKNKGVNRIVIKELINRDFGTLKRIRKVFGEKVELIVNSPCHMDCSYRMSHYNQQSSDSIKSTNSTSFNYYEHKCLHRRYNDLSNWIKICWIRPEDIKHYSNIGINYFKLQGRQTFKKGSDIVKTVEQYFKGSYDGDLMDLINCFAKMNSFKIHVDNKKLDGFLNPFIKKDNFCIRDCTECTYCDDFVDKCIEVSKAIEVKEYAKLFYSEFDNFKKLVREISSPLKKQIIDEIKEDGEFNF